MIARRFLLVLPLLGLLVVALPPASDASELCVPMMKGVCRDACLPDEQAEMGAFDDCGEKQDCCVKKSTSSLPAPKTQLSYTDPAKAHRMQEPQKSSGK